MSLSHDASLDEERLRRLLDVGRSIVADLDLEKVLTRVLEVARDLAAARYAAIGVLDEDGKGLERFITAGIGPEIKHQIGALPRGRGILGVLIDDPRPLCLADLGAHPKSYGFPPGHPPMRSFLGVPITIRGCVYGNLYLTEKEDGEFTRADEQAICVLADWAAIAIDNARNYEREHDRRHEVEQTMAGLEATLDISRALGGETDLGRVLELITKRARALVDARMMLILLHRPDAQELVITAVAGDVKTDVIDVGIRPGESIAWEVMQTRGPRRLLSLRDETDGVLADILDVDGGILMPLVYRSRALGVLCAFDPNGRDVFSDKDERLLEGFAVSAAIAVATAQTVAEDRLRRSVVAAERERSRWARELHDETLQELAGLRVTLAGARRQTPSAIPSLDQAIDQVDFSITGLRSLITDLRPAALDEHGLAAAIEALVERLRGATGVEIETAWEEGLAGTRHEAEVEETIYRLVQESINNAIHHAGPERVDISVREDEREILIEIRDDGRGFDPTAHHQGFGLLGMQERVALVGGTLEIRSSPGEGTTVSAAVPSRRSAG